jgi:hypothetical protein
MRAQATLDAAWVLDAPRPVSTADVAKRIESEYRRRLVEAAGGARERRRKADEATEATWWAAIEREATGVVGGVTPAEVIAGRRYRLPWWMAAAALHDRDELAVLAKALYLATADPKWMAAWRKHSEHAGRLYQWLGRIIGGG